MLDVSTQIAFFNFVPIVGGAEIVTMRLACGLHAHGWDVAYHARSALLDACLEAGVPARALSFASILRPPPLHYASHFINICHLAAKLSTLRRPFVVHAVGVTSAIYTVRAVPLRDVSVIWHLHDVLDPSPKHRLIVSNLLRCPNVHVASVSDAVLSSLLSFGVDPRRVERIYNGLDLDQWRPVAGSGEFRASTGTPPAAPVLACVGNLVAWKGADVFIEAAHRVDHPTAHWWIAGSAYTGDRTFELHLKKLAASGPAAHRIHFLGRQENIRGLMSEADILVQPSIRPDPLPTTVMEAMALARPVLGSRIGGIPEMISDGETGLLVPPADASALARAMERMLADSAAARGMGAAGRVVCERRFAIDTCVERFGDLYQRLVSAL